VLTQGAPHVWPSAAVHDTVAAIASHVAFRRNVRDTLFQRIMMWLGEWISQVIRMFRQSGAARPIGFAVVALLVIVVVARLLIAARARDEGIASRTRRGRKGPAEDPFVLADALASEGRFEDAAHALYRGVLLSLARNERVRLDPSKTSGDYARELRSRSSSVYQPFRSFARRFDVAVYGHGRCDADLITDLRALAAPFAPRARAA
jgi:Domain of unknown function (DUF4129)